MNFQNIPRTNKDVKSVFVPKLDCFLMFDYKQIEPRFLAYYLASIGDSELANRLQEYDTYTAVISQYYGRDNITEAERDEGKRLFLSLMYGGGTPTVMRQFGVDFKTAKRMTEQFHSAWPGIRQLQRLIDAVMEDRGYIKTPWGRHLHPVEAHKRLNALIQGSAADLMRFALGNVADYIGRNNLESHIVNVVHDEIIIDATMGEVFELTEQVPVLMDFPLISEVVPILTDIEWSTTTWADKTTYEGIAVV